LMDVVVVAEKVGRELSCLFELTILFDHGLELLDKCIFGVVTPALCTDSELPGSCGGRDGLEPLEILS